MSDFLMWQSVDAELFFVESYWPAFRRIDLLRALRTYAAGAERRAAKPASSAGVADADVDVGESSCPNGQQDSS